LAKIENFVKNRKFWQKSKIFSKVENFAKKVGKCWKKSKMLAKIKNFGKNGNFVKNPNLKSKM